MPLSPFNETGLYYERSGAGEALVLVHWFLGRRTYLGRRRDCAGAVVRGHHLRPTRPQPQRPVARRRARHPRRRRRPGWAHRGAGSAARARGRSIGGGSIALRLAATRPELVRTAFGSRAAPVRPPRRPGISGAGRAPALYSLLAAELLDAGDPQGREAAACFDQVARAPHGWAGLDPVAARDAAGERRHLPLSSAAIPTPLGIELESLAAFTNPALVTFGDRRPPMFRRDR